MWKTDSKHSLCPPGAHSPVASDPLAPSRRQRDAPRVPWLSREGTVKLAASRVLKAGVEKMSVLPEGAPGKPGVLEFGSLRWLQVLSVEGESRS